MNASTKDLVLHHGQPTVLRPQTLTELVSFAQVAAKSTMLPQAYIGKPENIIVAVQLGSELGLAPMQAIQNIAIIGGRPSVFGDAMAALVRQSPVCEDIEERFEGDGDNLVAVCIAKRVGKRPVMQSFSVDDAKRAGLWGKSGPWQQYPKRMLQMRARGFALRDAFPDVLRGLLSAEEAADIPTIEGTAEPTPAPEPSPASDRREAINREVPIAAAAATTLEAPFKRQTLKEWLAQFKADTEAAQTPEEASKVLDASMVMTDFLETRPAARAQYEAIRDACIKRVWAEPPEEDDEVYIEGEEKVMSG